MSGRPENLKPFQSTEEARQKGSNGGVKSGQTRRKKRDMKVALEYLMEMPISAGEENLNEMMNQMEIPEDDRSRMMAMLVSMFREAVYNGNVKAAEFIRDTVGAGAIFKERKEKLKLERERFELEKKAMTESGEGMPIIVNVRPQLSSAAPEDPEDPAD